MNIKDFALISFLSHIAIILTIILIILVPLNLTNNSDITNEFTDGKIKALKIKLVPKVYTQTELNRPIYDFMEEENFELLLEENCSTPFQDE